jgi:hypothetical protein
MKFNVRPMLALILGLVSSALILDKAGFDYNLFRSSFDFWRLIIRLGTPTGCVMIWFLILQGVPRPGSR